jgi:hypothetical protein
VVAAYCVPATDGTTCTTITTAIGQLLEFHEDHGEMPILISDGVREFEITAFGATWKSKVNGANQVNGHATICFKGPATRIISYSRDGKANRSAPYARKFAGFIDAIAEAEKDGSEVMVIAEHWAIGDTHEEFIESLSRLGATHISLIVAHD